jgi:hypothetical protein
MWRNFTQGRFGTLDARQYQEVQDATAQQTWRRRDIDKAVVQRGRTMLVKIGPKKGSSSGEGQSQVPGAIRVRGQAYEFTQMLMRLDNNGTIELAERPYGLRSVVPGAFSEFYAVDLNPVSNLAVGTYALVVPVEIDMGNPGFAFDEKMFYYEFVFVVVGLAGETQSKLLQVTQVMDEQGHYRARERDPVSGAVIGDPVDLYNTYELEGNNWYGALAASDSNRCASVGPLPLQAGHYVLATQYASTWYTIAPTPFEVTCLCNDKTTPEGAARIEEALEMKAASAMLRLHEGLL